MAAPVVVTVSAVIVVAAVVALTLVWVGRRAGPVAGSRRGANPTTAPSASQISLAYPGGLVVGGDGSVYVADTGNNRVRRVSPTGAVSTVAGGPNAGYNGDGVAAGAAELNDPTGVAVTGDGSVLIADSGNNRVRRVSATGIISTLAGDGHAGYAGDGASATASELDQPAAVAVGRDGSVFVADYGNNRIRRVSPSGTVSTVAGVGRGGLAGDGGPANAAELNGPTGVAVAGDGSIYIADRGNDRIRRVSPIGLIATVAGEDDNDYSAEYLQATATHLSHPGSVAVGADGSIYIADYGDDVVRRVYPAGFIVTVAGIRGRPGFSGDNGSATLADLAGPTGVAVSPGGNVYITDELNNRLRRVSPAGVITTVAGDGQGGFSGDNAPATAAELTSPSGVAVAGDGNIYLVDQGNNRLRRVSPAGIITTVAGDGREGSTGDNGPAAHAELTSPYAVALAGDGTIYVSDYGNNRVRRISPAGVITTLAGEGEGGATGDGGSANADRLASPAGLAVGRDGSVYIAEVGAHRVRRVSEAGVITTVAGDGRDGFGGDHGPATAAQLSFPDAVALAADGSIYIADTGNNRVRRVSPAGVITTVAGDGHNGFSGDDGPATAAELRGPQGLAVAADNSLYLADNGNNRVRRISPTGVITTVAGSGDFIADGAAATDARLNGPNAVAVADDGSIYIADYANNRVRRVNPIGIITTVAGISSRP